MDQAQLTQLSISIAEKVTSDVDVRIALVGAFGVVIGALITGLFNLLLQARQESPKKELDKKRERLLKEMLLHEVHAWRNISTLSAVIGTGDEETRRLLINIGARGSETSSNSWGLIKRNPLPTAQ